MIAEKSKCIRLNIFNIVKCSLTHTKFPRKQTQRKMAEDTPFSRFVGVIMILWSLTVIGLLSWETNWIVKNKSDLSTSLHIWSAMAVGGSFFTYAILFFVGINTTCGDTKSAEDMGNWAPLPTLIGFVCSCGCIHIWRTFEGMNDEETKMLGWIGFTGISTLYLAGFIIIMAIFAGCCCSSKMVKQQTSRTSSALQQDARIAEIILAQAAQMQRAQMQQAAQMQQSDANDVSRV